MTVFPGLAAAIRRRPAPVLGWATAALAAAVAGAATAVRVVTGRFWGDLAAFRSAAAAAADGDGAVYEIVFRAGEGVAFGYPYPPFATLLFQPLAQIGMPLAVGVWTSASVVALVAVVWATLRATGLAADRRAVPALVLTLGSLPMFAVLGHLQVGQVGLFLMLIVLLDLTGDPQRRWRGLGVGLAAGIKLTPLIFIAFLVLTGRIRAAGTAVAGFAATIAIGFVWWPDDSSWYWGGGFFDSSRVTTDARTVLNQSLHGALARLADTSDPGLMWWLVAALVGMAGLAVAAWWVRAGDELSGILACAITGLLISPASWHHHWVWCVPGLTLLVARSWRPRHPAGLAAAALIWLVFVASTTWVLASPYGWDLHFHGWGLLYSNLYVLVGLIALAGMAGYGYRTARRS